MSVLSHISNGCSTNYVVKYAREVYDIRILCRNSVMFITTRQETYKVEFNSHCRKYMFSSDTGHTVIDSFFERGLFKIASKPFYDEIGLAPTSEDWCGFFNDAYKYGVI